MRVPLPLSRAAGLLLLVLSVSACNGQDEAVPPPADGALRVATMKTHYFLPDATDDEPWSVTGWQRQRGAMAEVLRDLDADLFAFQEMESFRRGLDGSVNLARDHLLAALPEFSLTASGNRRQFPATQPIFYRTKRLRLLEQGWFFFSDMPDISIPAHSTDRTPHSRPRPGSRITAPARGCASSTCIWISAAPGTG